MKDRNSFKAVEAAANIYNKTNKARNAIAVRPGPALDNRGQRGVWATFITTGSGAHDYFFTDIRSACRAIDMLRQLDGFSTKEVR